MIDPITEQILFEEKLFINEGVLSTFNKVFVLLGFGTPADPRVKAIYKAAEKCKYSCWKAYPDKTSTTTKQKSRTDSNGKQSDEEVRRDREETIQSVENNPDRGKCLIMCTYDKLKELISVIKKNQKTICNRNMNKDLCEKWVDKYLPELEADLKSLENAVRLMKGAKEGDQQKIKVVVNTLKKIL